MRRLAILAIAGLAAFAAAAASAFANTNGMLAAVSDGKLVTLNTDGSGLRMLWTPPEGTQITALAWSPDGNTLAMTYGDRIAIFDLVSRRPTVVTVPPAGARDLDPAWSPGSDRVAFRRILDAATQERDSVSATDGSDLRRTSMSEPVAALSFSPDLSRVATVDLLNPPQLLVSGVPIQLDKGVLGTPAWAPDGEARVAYVDGFDDAPYPAGLRVVTPTSGFDAEDIPITGAPVGSPRWSGDGQELAYVVAGEIRTVEAKRNSVPNTVRGLTGATAVDWQPCSSATNVRVGCVSYEPPRCSSNQQTVTTQADRPVDVPGPLCERSDLGLSTVVVNGPEHGVLEGQRYTPAPGFVGQDGFAYQVTNGFAESQVVQVKIFVVPRPTPAVVAPTPAPIVRRAPFLTARATPKLDRKRTTLVRLACDQNCSFQVRLTGQLKKHKKTLKGSLAKHALVPDHVLSLRLRLPTKPKGKLKIVWIVGTVRNPTGESRGVKLPVRLPR